MACIAKRRWRYVIDFYDAYGKRRWITMPKGSTKKKAHDKLREIEDQLKRGVYLPDKRIPTFKEVARDWIEYKRINLRPSTWSVYEGHTRNHFNDLNAIKINRISTAKIEKFIVDRQTEGMNINTLRKILVTLNQIMAYAVRHGFIDYSPVRDAERPRGQGKIKTDDIRVLSPVEINKFINSAKNQKYRVLFMLAIMSGARQGELIGLKWPDIDWLNNQIHIKRTFNNGGWYIPKSKASIRKIDLGSAMMVELKKWRLACPLNKLDLVFPNDAGNVIDNSTMLKGQFFPALKDAGLPRIRFHDLRHTKASIMIEQGENIKYIQTQLGHSSPSVTLDVYAHLMKPTNQEAAERFENLIFEKDGSNTVAK
jgi:integrase